MFNLHFFEQCGGALSDGVNIDRVVKNERGYTPLYKSECMQNSLVENYWCNHHTELKWLQ